MTMMKLWGSVLSLVQHEDRLARSGNRRETVPRPAVVEEVEEVADHHPEVHRAHVSQNDHRGRVLDESIYLGLCGE